LGLVPHDRRPVDQVETRLNQARVADQHLGTLANALGDPLLPPLGRDGSGLEHRGAGAVATENLAAPWAEIPALGVRYVDQHATTAPPLSPQRAAPSTDAPCAW